MPGYSFALDFLGIDPFRTRVDKSIEPVYITGKINVAFHQGSILVYEVQDFRELFFTRRLKQTIWDIEPVIAISYRA